MMYSLVPSARVREVGEMNGEAFQGTLTDFWTSIQELAKDPTSAVTQGLFVQSAVDFGGYLIKHTAAGLSAVCFVKKIIPDKLHPERL